MASLLSIFDAIKTSSVDTTAQEQRQLGLAKLKTFDAQVRFHAEKISGAEIPLEQLAMDLSLSDGVLVVDPFRLQATEGQVLAHLTLDASVPESRGNVTMHFDHMAVLPLLAPIIGLPRVNGIVDGKLVLAFSSDSIGMADGRIRYRAPDKNTDLALELSRVQDGKEWLLQMQGGGKFRGASTKIRFTGQPFLLWTTPDASVPIALAMSLADTDVAIDGTVASFGKELDLHASMSGPGTERLSRITGTDMPRFPSYAVSGHVVKSERAILIDDLRARIGKSDFAGSALVDNVDAFQKTFRARGDTGSNEPRREPFIRLDLAAKTLAYSDFDQLLAKEGKSPGWLERLNYIDADVDIAIDRFIAPKQVVLRNLRLDGLLEDGALTLAPLRFEVGDGKVVFNAALRLSEKEKILGTIDAEVEKVHLAKALKPLGLGKQFPGWLDASIVLALGAKIGKPTKPGIVRYNDKSGTNLRITLTQAASGLHIKGDGRFENEPFSLRGSAGPLARVMGNRPYPFNIDVTMLETNGKIKGSLRHPLQLAGLKSTLEISGPNPRRAESLFGFRLPELPPYRLKGDLSRQNGVWRFTDFKGTVGDSDLTGRISVDNTKGRPYISANLHSDLLDLDDLAGIIGAAPGAEPDEVASPPQRKKALERRRRSTVLPDEDFEFDLLSKFNADVHYDADSIDAGKLPLDNLTMDFSLNDGRLLLTPIMFGAAGGTVTANIRLVERPGERPVRGKVELAVNGVKLAEIVKNYDMADDTTGSIGGEARFQTQGESVAKMLASLDGEASFVMAGGTLDALLVELAGLDGGEALLLWLGQEQAVKVRCAYISATARSGVLNMDNAVVDTTDTRFTMDGKVHFGDEALDLVIRAHPKDFSIFAARAPLVVEGRFKTPDFHPSWSSLVARGAAALSLAAISPPAALLALIEPGMGENAPCTAKDR